MDQKFFYPEFEDRLSEIYFRSIVKNPDTFNRAVHQDDEMYLFIQEKLRDREVGVFSTYLESGKQMIDVLRHIVAWGFGGFEEVRSFLDFACGYGRFMRFLVQELPAERIWVSDIYAEAVKFQREQFGVNAMESTPRPQEYADSNRYDCVFVASLFSHLPEETFLGWLAKLYSLLKLEGLLVFSLNDVAIMPANLSMGSGGIVFVPESESRTLDKTSYGTTYVSSAFVDHAIRQLATPAPLYHRIPRGLWSAQDLYVVSRDSDRDFSNLDVSLGPSGNLDGCHLTDSGHYWFEGWAADFNKGCRIHEVQILVNGELQQRCLPVVERPDVAAAYADEKGRYSGWSCGLQAKHLDPRDVIMVKIVNNKHCEKMLYFGTLQSVLQPSA
jgi:2-polyprenyl-3-methyl-5-hydroxy-6-metoxy-1,4-benzoquinol methylase